MRALNSIRWGLVILACGLCGACATQRLNGDTAQEAANRKLVLEFWRVVYEAHHVELADKYLAPEYVQHNPNIASGRDAIVALLGKTGPIDVRPELMLPPEKVIAKDDLVVLVFPREQPDPTDPTKLQKWYGFDMLRVKNGRIVEHWDAIVPRAPGTPYVSPPPPWVRYEQLQKMHADQERALRERQAQGDSAPAAPK